MRSSEQSRSPIIKPVIWPEVLEVPPEIWALAAALSGRQSTGRLCTVSLRFFSTFSPLLYCNTMDPPLTGAQYSLLIKTLSKAHNSTEDTPSTSYPDSARLSPSHVSDGTISGWMRLSGLPMRSSALRTLEWDLSEGSDMRALLRKPGNFPNLQEISIYCSPGGKAPNFNFIQVPYLVKMKCTLVLYASYKSTPDLHREWWDTFKWRPTLNALNKALKNLLMSSPHL
ncbi:hypothetical protein B0H17DRAFT_1200273 [Mycena rosella]|uniref:Uncharacterized protein n=1 Tax=Mycena rosella TaxID=1033263 RepID=A0AAD7GK07_MYCRO|nr:hypothetical protein B0H17DRAFT_1200273 [Mycena rosella]